MITLAEFNRVVRKAQKDAKPLGVAVTSWAIDNPASVTFSHPDKQVTVRIDLEAEDATIEHLADLLNWQLYEYKESYG